MSARQRLSAAQAATGRDRDLVAEMFRKVFRTTEGTLVLDEIVKLCGVDVTGFAPDAQTMAYRCGMRDAGLVIWKLAMGEREIKPEVKTNE